MSISAVDSNSVLSDYDSTDRLTHTAAGHPSLQVLTACLPGNKREIN